jgi:hypothetical protein
MEISASETINARPIRPRSVTILAWLQVLQSLSVLALRLFFSTGWLLVDLEQAAQFLPLALFDHMFSISVTLLLSVLGILIAIALYRLRPWAWLAAMSLQGLGLLAALIGYINQHPNYIGMLISILLVLYLNQNEVKAAFFRK